MSGADSCTAEPVSNGVKGLAMMAPFVGVPVLFHALSGTVVTGLGFVTIASALTPFKDDLIKAAKSIAGELSVDLEKIVPQISLAETLKGVGGETVNALSSGEQNVVVARLDDPVAGVASHDHGV